MVSETGSENTLPAISYESALSGGEDFMVILAEQKIFEKKQETLTPSFITDPFVRNSLSDISVISLFLSPEDSFSHEILLPDQNIFLYLTASSRQFFQKFHHARSQRYYPKNSQL